MRGGGGGGSDLTRKKILGRPKRVPKVTFSNFKRFVVWKLHLQWFRTIKSSVEPKLPIYRFTKLWSDLTPPPRMECVEKRPAPEPRNYFIDTKGYTAHRGLILLQKIIKFPIFHYPLRLYPEPRILTNFRNFPGICGKFLQFPEF